MCSGSEEEPVVGQKKKRSRIIMDDSDSDNENVETPKKSHKKHKSKKLKLKSDEESSPEKRHTSSPKKSSHHHHSKKAKRESRDSSSRERKEKAGKSLESFAFEKSTGSEKSADKGTPKVKNESSKLGTETITRWVHEKLDFLKPDKIRDVNKNRPGHPEYDAKTLHVPKEYLNSLTPAMRQWWILKSRHLDSVLFFKVGKFYELYHMDATVGVNHLGFSYMKVCLVV